MAEKDDFLELIAQMKQQLADLAAKYKDLRQGKASEVSNNPSNSTATNNGQTTPATQDDNQPNNTNNNENSSPAAATPPPAAASGSDIPTTLTGSVGKGGQNNEVDVRAVQARLVRNAIQVTIDGKIGPQTIAAIERFQQARIGTADGRVDPGGNTWKALMGQQVPRVEAPANNAAAPAAGAGGTLEEIARRFNVEVAVIRAIQEVESGGSGYLSDGRPKILFEGHIFWSELRKVGIDPNTKVRGNEDILYQRWVKTHYKGGAAEYTRLEKAIRIHRIAALKSASWGEYQIMGFNHSAAGYPDVESFVEAIKQGQGNTNNINALMGFLKANNILRFVQGANKNWAAFAERYNGPGYKQNRYDTKLAAAYEKHKRQGG